MNDFRVHYLEGSYDPGHDPKDWTTEYLVWFYWTRRYDETLKLFMSKEQIAGMWASKYWRQCEAEMEERGAKMHIGLVAV